MKRGRVFSTWIKFGEVGLAQLVVGVEACCEGKFFIMG